MISLKLGFKGIASRLSLLLDSITSCGGLRINCINPSNQPLLHAINFLLNSVASRGCLRVDSIDSAAQLSRAAENRSKNREHPCDKRHAREHGLKTHLDHSSILTRTIGLTHLSGESSRTDISRICSERSQNLVTHKTRENKFKGWPVSDKLRGVLDRSRDRGPRSINFLRE